jgi:hypothetical protein
MKQLLGFLAGLVLVSSVSLAPPADATLQAALSVDGGASLLACDQNTCVGGGLPTFQDLDPAVGVLTTGPAFIGPISASFAIQTSIKGDLNTLSSGGTVVQNTDPALAHALQLTIGDTDFIGPAVEFTLTGSGTWLDPTAPALFGGTQIVMQWFNDPANVQGATFAGDTPGILLNTAFDAPVDGTANQSFGGPGTAFNVSGPTFDPANFSMTLDNELVLGPGIRLESRGQALSKPVAVAWPMTSVLLGLGLVGIGWQRRRTA